MYRSVVELPCNKVDSIVTPSMIYVQRQHIMAVYVISMQGEKGEYRISGLTVKFTNGDTISYDSETPDRIVMESALRALLIAGLVPAHSLQNDLKCEIPMRVDRAGHSASFETPNRKPPQGGSGTAPPKKECAKTWYDN